MRKFLLQAALTAAIVYSSVKASNWIGFAVLALGMVAWFLNSVMIHKPLPQGGTLTRFSPYAKQIAMQQILAIALGFVICILFFFFKF